MSENNRIAQNTIFLYIRMFIVLIVTLYTTRILLKSLGEVDFGVNNVVAGVVSMFAFLNASLTACIQRFYNFEHGKNGDDGMNNVYITSCIIQILLSLAVFLFVEIIGVWYMNNILVVPDERLHAAIILFHCTVVSLVFVVIQVPYSSAIMAYEKMNYYAYIGIVDVCLKLLVAFIITFYSGDKLILYGILLALISFVDFILYYAYVKIKFTKLQFKFIFDRLLFKKMIYFAGWSMFGSFAMVMRNQGLSMILNAFFGPIVNAARGVSYNIKGGLVGFINNISTATRPQVVEAFAKKDFTRSTKLTFASTKVCYYLLYAMALPVAYEMNYILKLWLGSSIPENTVIFSILILVIALIDGLNPPMTTLIYATGRNSLYNLMTSIGGLLVLPLSYFTLKAGMHPASVYVASIIISILVQAISIWCLKHETGIPILLYLKSVILPCCLVSLLTIALPLPIITFIEPSFIRLLITSISTISVVGTASYFFGLSKEEKNLVKSILGNLVSKFKK